MWTGTEFCKLVAVPIKDGVKSNGHFAWYTWVQVQDYGASSRYWYY